MPAPPKFGNSSRGVRLVEVDIESKSQPQCYTDSNVGISREVAVDLYRIPIDRHEIFETGVKGGGIEDSVDEVEADIVGDNSFFEETTHDEE